MTRIRDIEHRTVDRGHPSAGLLPNGRILCLYHECDTADRPLQYVMSTHFRVED